MRKSYRILLAVGALVLLGLGFVFLYSGISGDPRLAISFLRQTNGSGRLVAFFTVTNSGNCPAVSFGQGSLEVFGKRTTMVACRFSHHELLPGQGDVLQVVLPSGFVGRWRFTALYARAGPRARIYDWQWGRNGPGARVNWLIPGSLKGVPLDIVATSDWIGADTPPDPNKPGA